MANETFFTARKAAILLVGLLWGLSASAQTKSGSYLAIVKWTHIVPDEGGSTTCVIVGSDGQFHLESIPDSRKVRKNKAKPIIATGFLPDEYLEQLKRLLDTKELIDMGSPEPPSELVWRRETDAIVLSIHRQTGSQDPWYANADGSHPMPKPIAAFIPWVKAVSSLNDNLVQNPELNMCHALEPTETLLPQLVRR